jgi:hypothetical protein
MGRSNRSTTTMLEMGSWWGRCTFLPSPSWPNHPGTHILNDVERCADAASIGCAGSLAVVLSSLHPVLKTGENTSKDIISAENQLSRGLCVRASPMRAVTAASYGPMAHPPSQPSRPMSPPLYHSFGSYPPPSAPQSSSLPSRPASTLIRSEPARSDAFPVLTSQLRAPNKSRNNALTHTKVIISSLTIRPSPLALNCPSSELTTTQSLVRRRPCWKLRPLPVEWLYITHLASRNSHHGSCRR